MTDELDGRDVRPGGRLLELVVGVIAALVSLVAVSLVIHRAQDRIAEVLGHAIVDRGDEWHPLSMIVLLLVPLICGYQAARSLRRREPSPRA